MSESLSTALDDLDRHAAGVQSGAAKALSNATQVRHDIADVRAALTALPAGGTEGQILSIVNGAPAWIDAPPTGFGH